MSLTRGSCIEMALSPRRFGGINGIGKETNGAAASRLLGPYEAEHLALVPARDGAAGGIFRSLDDGARRNGLPGWTFDPGEALVDQHLVVIADLAIIGDTAVRHVAALDRRARARPPRPAERLEPARESWVGIARSCRGRGPRREQIGRAHV